MYNIIAVEGVSWDRLQLTLGDLFSVPVGDVEVVNSGEFEDRNLGARVSCEYQRLSGDVSWALDIYATNEVQSQPTEPALAAGLAGWLRQTFLFPDAGIRPSSYWAATADGRMVRARVFESDTEDFFIRVDAIEEPVSGLAHVPIERIPEVIRDSFVPSPLVDSFAAWLKGCEEMYPDSDGVKESGEHLFVGSLRAWEMMTVRISQGWPPSAWYPAEFYREDLDNRDSLCQISNDLPAAISKAFLDVLNRIDGEFIRLTVDDGGVALDTEMEILDPAPPVRNWWWRRRPIELPWNSS
ncbi:hypothetical protein GCM10009664_54250 [Kitasatospora gansuensis]